MPDCDMITLRLKFCAAHRLVHHGGKCNRLHGHNYVLKVTVASTVPDLGPSGMVADFALIKEIIGGWVDKNWDHQTVLNSDDPMLWNPLTGGNAVAVSNGELIARYGHVPFTMPRGQEPTAENMARYVRGKDWFSNYPTIRDRVKLRRVTLFETDTCSATSECS